MCFALRAPLVACFMVMMVHVSPSQSYRAMWVDAFHAGLRNPGEIDVLLERAKIAKLNALFVQVRARAAAYHHSRYDPPAHDKDPGFDALAYILQKSRDLSDRMEIHAWMNAHPLWPASHDPPFAQHVVHRKPEWLTKSLDGETATDVGRALDYGHPKAADYLWRTYMEVVRNYPVAGIHLDFIRYTGTRWGYNPQSVERFNRRHGRSGQPEPNDPAWMQWRRDQVTAMVRKIYATATALRWDIVVSAALVPWGQAPSASRPWEETRPYAEVFADWRSWLEEGSLDIGMPMWYANQQRLPQYLREWLAWAKQQPFASRVLAGLGAYLNTPADTMSQIRMAAEAVPLGFCLFSYASTCDLGEGIRTYDRAVYEMLGAAVEKAPKPPALPWKQEADWGIVHGTLLDPNLNPLDGATVCLKRGSEEVASTVTDGTGFYAFLRVPPGRYEVQVTTLRWPVHMIRGVTVLARTSVPGHGIVGSPKDLIRRAGSLGKTEPGASVCLVNLRVVSADPLVLQDPIGGGQVLVREASPPELQWMEGDVVAVRGTLAEGEERPILENAIVTILGVEQ